MTVLARVINWVDVSHELFDQHFTTSLDFSG